ncbi:MAG: serine hydrolase domain-containing protein [Gemmatimonadales bacterium]
MSRARILVLGAAVAAASLFTSALDAQRHFPSDSAIRAILDDQVTTKGTVGLVLGVMEADGSTRIFSAGRSGSAAALDGNTVFEIGSITKVFTTALLADMVSRGEVALDDPVQKYLPSGVTVPSRNGKQITLANLAAVNSGLPRTPTNFRPADRSNPFADYTVAQLYEFLNGYTLPRDIGAEYEYSNVGMGLLGHALGLRLGKSYIEAVDERILTPLGMKSTAIELTPSMQQRLAPGHNKEGTIVPNWDIPTLAGTGAIRSTVNDMFKLLAANLNPASKPLGASLATTHAARTKTSSPAMSVGLGWHIRNAPSGPIVWHNGGTGGYRAFMGFDPATKVGVVLLTNTAVSADNIGYHLIKPEVPLTAGR